MTIWGKFTPNSLRQPTQISLLNPDAQNGHGVQRDHQYGKVWELLTRKVVLGETLANPENTPKVNPGAHLKLATMFREEFTQDPPELIPNVEF